MAWSHGPLLPKKETSKYRNCLALGLGAENEFRPRELTPWPRLAKYSFPQHGFHSLESEKGLIQIELCIE